VNGAIKFLPTAGGTLQLCRNPSFTIALCSSSLRYKTDLHPFVGGLNLVNRLHPITFKWKADQTLDLGLGAEDVAAVEPLLVTRNDKGEVEGVKYDRLSAVFINAFKEQQNQIKQQQDQIRSLSRANAGLSTRLQAIERRLQKRAVHARRRSG
jgi:endosialidase-like protein